MQTTFFLEGVERKLFLFDAIGTLVDDGRGGIPNTRGEVTPLPGRKAVGRALRAAGHVTGVVSNQGGVAWGYLSHGEAGAVVRAAGDVVGAVYTGLCPHYPNVPDAYAVLPWARACRCRKPAPFMLKQAMATLAPRFGFDGSGFYWDGIAFVRDRTIYVGDDLVADKLAAERAGVIFCEADYFFGGAWRRLAGLEEVAHTGPI